MTTFQQPFDEPAPESRQPELTIPSKIIIVFRDLRTEQYPQSSQDYLLGLRGLLTIQAFLWHFLTVFAPTAVKDSHNTTGPVIQLALRKTISVLCWNTSLIYLFIVVLSARSIGIPFITSPTSVVVASSVFRRWIRLLIPTFAASILVVIFFSGGKQYIDEFKDITENVSFETPYTPPGFVGFCNAIFNLFWVTRDFASQAGSRAFPGQMLWIVTLL